MVSIIIPCFNEKQHIDKSIRSILAQEPTPGGFEIIIVDGLSFDGTRDILQRLAAQHSELRIVDNPRRATPCGMNAGIREARGCYVAILGAHTEYATDYVRRCVELLEEHPEVCCVGGPIISRGKNLFGQAAAAAMSHPVGVGNAKHRFPDYEGYAEGACYPVFRKEVFVKIGLFDENLIRNQDDEFNYRLAREGKKVFISPRARATYFVRETPRELFRQYFQYGFWRVAVLRKHAVPAAWRQIVPAAFLLLAVSALIAGFFLQGWWRMTAVLLPVLYGSVLGASAVRVAREHGAQVGILWPVAAAIMHVAYACGFIAGILNRTTPPRSEASVYSGGECHASRR
jgi:succinoglycan biosynthesis protein ExoA